MTNSQQHLSRLHTAVTNHKKMHPMAMLEKIFPSHWVCKPVYLVPVPSQDNVGGLRQEGHPA